MDIELIILLLAVLAVIAIYFVLKTAKHLIVNTILGLIILAVGNYFFLNQEINYTPIVLLVCALGGVPGALLVIILHFLNMAF